MELIKQNDPSIDNKNINNNGCRFRCLQAIAEFITGKALTTDGILKIYETLSNQRYHKQVMTKSCLCQEKEHKIIDFTFKHLNSTKTGRQVGYMKHGAPIAWCDKPNIPCKDFDFVLLHWRTWLGEDGHYTLADNKENEIFDPWDNSKNDMKKIEVVRKFLYRVKG